MQNNPESSNVQKTRLDLPPRIKGKCVEVLKSSISQKDAQKALSNAQIPASADAKKIAELFETMPPIFSAFFSKDIGLASRESGVNPIDIQDMSDIATKIAERICTTRDLSDFEISIGLGGALNVPNVRIAGYILPALKTLAALNMLKEQGKVNELPKVVIFKANHLANAINGYDLARLQKVTEITFAYLNSFVERFFPDIRHQVIFTQDKDASKNPAFMDQLNNYAAFLKQHEDLPEIKNIVDMGQKHGGEKGERDSLIYAAAHAVLPSLVPTRDGRALEDISSTPSVIITHGGVPQATFNQAVRIIIEEERKQNVSAPVIPTVGLITIAGKRPPYYTARDGDIPLGTDFDYDPRQVDRATRADYEELFAAISPEEFSHFVHDFNTTWEVALRQLSS